MPVSNRLLLKIPPYEFKTLESKLESVELPFKRVLAEPGEPITHAYFVDSGVVSVVNEPEDGRTVEVATIGPEGLAGFHVILGALSVPSKSIVQIPGRGRRITVNALLEVVEGAPGLRQLLMRYTMALLTQISQGTSCNRAHEVQERCARWLLMTHDRVEGDSFPITQEFLSQMLGVHRPTVSVAAAMLQKAGLIDYVRGTVTILNRDGLEAASCSCYRVIMEEYERLVGK